ncbi:MAG: HtaA domain-containing protein [Actinobacteria bacterium]|nr:HtaA domain-containing protein [Actinomycetota bacterium]
MRSTGLRSLPIAVAIAAVALLATAASAAAAMLPIKGGEVDWGIKASFRSYIKSPIAAGKIELSNGAVEAAGGTYKFPVESGTYDLTTHATEVQTKGTVHFTGHYTGEVPALDMSVSDPRILLEGETGAVFADVKSKSLETGETKDYPGVEFATLDTSEVAPSFEGEAVSLGGIPAKLTAAGAEAFAGFYTAGTTLDPVGVVASFEPTPPPVEEEEKTEDPKTEGSNGDGSKPDDSSKAADPVPAPVLPLPTLKKATRGAAMIGGGGAAGVATVSCPTAQACTLQAPRNVKFKAGGKQWSAKVIAPHWILPGKSGKVAVKVPRGALEHLAGGKAKISLKLVLGIGTQSTTQVVNATLKARGN